MMKVTFLAIYLMSYLMVVVMQSEILSESLLTTIVRDLPSTTVLILFVWLTNKQFHRGMDMMGDHLKDLNVILEQCIKKRNLDEKIQETDLKLSELERLLEDLKKKQLNE